MGEAKAYEAARVTAMMNGPLIDSQQPGRFEAERKRKCGSGVVADQLVEDHRAEVDRRQSGGWTPRTRCLHEQTGEHLGDARLLKPLANAERRRNGDQHGQVD